MELRCDAGVLFLSLREKKVTTPLLLFFLPRRIPDWLLAVFFGRVDIAERDMAAGEKYPLCEGRIIRSSVPTALRRSVAAAPPHPLPTHRERESSSTLEPPPPWRETHPLRLRYDSSFVCVRAPCIRGYACARRRERVCVCARVLREGYRARGGFGRARKRGARGASARVQPPLDVAGGGRGDCYLGTGTSSDAENTETTHWVSQRR